MTNRDTILWKGEDAYKKCLYKRIGTFDATIVRNHIIVEELQTSFISKPNNSNDIAVNCGTKNPQFTDNDIIIEFGNTASNHIKFTSNHPNQTSNMIKDRPLLKNNPQERTDAKNPKFQ